jgi:hypothetical protein
MSFLRNGATGADPTGTPSGQLTPVTHSSSLATPAWFVSLTGNNNNPGTEALPFRTVQRAHDVAVAGDTIYVRGGTYDISSQLVFSRSGVSGRPITLRNYPGEIVRLDGINNPNMYGHSVIRLQASYWTIDGVQVLNSPGQGIRVEGARTGITIRNCVVSGNVRLDSSGAAIQAGGGSTNILIENNDVYDNGKAGTGGGDGIGIYDITSATANIIIRGNRMAFNNDDGLDLFNSRGDILVENNWSWRNGHEPNNTATTGDGIGFKLGGGGVSTDGGHIVRFNIAWMNKGGFDENSSNKPLVLYNNTAYRNTNYNYAFYSPVANVLRNNLADTPDTVSFNNLVDDTFNSWNLGVTVDNGDFASVDYSCADDPRNADGSLPNCSFLTLVTGSDLIDRGLIVGLPYLRSAPDLGAREY